MAMQPMRPRQQRRMDNRREIATGGQMQAPQRPMQRPQQPMPGPAPVQIMGQQGMQTPTAGLDQGMRMPGAGIDPGRYPMQQMPQGPMPISKPGTEMGQNVYRPAVMPGQFGGGMSGLAQAHPMGNKFNPNVSQNDPAFAQNPQAQGQMMQYRQRMLQRQGQPRGLMAQPPKPVIPNSGGGY